MQSKIRKTKVKRPLFPNHNEKCEVIVQNLIGLGQNGHSGDVLALAKDKGMRFPIQTCKQRDQSYTRDNLYGVELEISSDLDSSAIYKLAPYPFFIIKSDSSVVRCRSFPLELVGLPATLKANSILWATLADKLIEKCENDLALIGGREEGTNGMHVHVDRENFIDTRHKRNFLAVFNAPWHSKFILDVSDRTNWNILTRWAKPAWNTTVQNNIGIGKFLKEIESNTRRQEKYAFTNVRHANTIEVRIFQGDLSAASIIKNLQFVDSVVEFTKERSIATCELPFYLSWLEKTDGNRYSELKEFLKQIKLDEALAEYEMFKAIFSKSRMKVYKENPKKWVFNTGFSRVVNRIQEMGLSNIVSLKFKEPRSNMLEPEEVTITLNIQHTSNTKLFSHHKTTVHRYRNCQLAA